MEGSCNNFRGLPVLISEFLFQNDGQATDFLIDILDPLLGFVGGVALKLEFNFGKLSYEDVRFFGMKVAFFDELKFIFIDRLLAGLELIL